MNNLTDTTESILPGLELGAWNRLGIRVYGAGAILLGLVGLVSGDFADVWQPVPAGTPGRKILAYLVALLFLAAGTAIQLGGGVRFGARTLGILYLIFGLLWLPRVVAYPRIFGTWGGVFEQLSLVAAAMIVYACAEKAGSSGRSLAKAGRLLFGICAVVFGLNHFFAIPETAAMVPGWIPPGQHFWAVATGVAHFLAGLAILSGVLAVAASRLLALMIVLFGVLVWGPSLFAHPQQHMVWAGNAINLAIAGAAWVVSDFIANRRLELQAGADFEMRGKDSHRAGF